MFPAASYANVESVLMWLLESTVEFSMPNWQGGRARVPELIFVGFATASSAALPSGPKTWPQQSVPDVADDCADRMRFSGSYVKDCVRPVSTLLVMPVTVPLSPPATRL